MALTKVSRGLLSTSIVDNGNATAITIDSSENVGIGVSSPSSYYSDKLVVDVGTGEDGITLASSNTTGASYIMWADGTSANTRYSGYIGYNHGSDFMQFATNDGVERMRIDSSGNMGIGVIPEAWNPAFTEVLQVGPASLITSGGDNARVFSNAYYDGAYKRIGTGYAHSYEQTGGTHRWFSAASGSADSSISWAESMRIDSSGNLNIGTTGDVTSTNAGVQLRADNTIRVAKSGLAAMSIYRHTNNGSIISFYRDATNVGSISVTSSSTSYNTSSDYRLKENVVELTGATERLKQLNPSRFNFIADADTTVDGFLAHEVADVVPEAISGEKDAMKDEEYEVTPAVLDEEGNVVTEAVIGTRSVPEYQGIDQSKLVPLLVATIQELEARITELENN